MPWPSTLSSFTDPTPSDRLSTTPHSSIESAQNTGVKELQAFVGTLSSTAGTLIYDIRATASDGGGHVQTANKGGTGQTSYTKGDILVASSSSVLSKLSVGTDGTVPTADSAASAGVSWQGVANAANIQNQTYTYARASVMSGSVFGVVLSQSPSLVSDGLGLVVKFPAAPTSSAMALSVHTTSSGSVAARIKKTNLNDPETTDITASMIGILTFESVSSVFQLLNVSATGTTYKSGVSSWAGDATSGTLNVPHGLGAVPKIVRISAIKRGTTNNTGVALSNGSYDGATNAVAYLAFGNPDTAAETTGNAVTGSCIAIYDAVAGGSQGAAATVDATNIILAWVKSGSPSATNINFRWEVNN